MLSSLKSHSHQASVAVGSSASLERSAEQNRDMDHKVRKKNREHERTHNKSRDRDCEVDHSFQGRIGIMTAPQIMTTVLPSSMAALMSLVIPWSVTQRSNDYAVRAHHTGWGIDAPTHRIVLLFWCLWYFIQL